MREHDETWQRAFGHMKMKGETERKIHKRIVGYLKTAHPQVRFCSTLDGEKFGSFQAQAVRALQWGRGIPDLLIFHPTQLYTGLALEIKKDTVFRKDGKLKAGEHLAEQQDWLDYFSNIGWCARFGCGFSQSIDIIDSYFSNNLI